MTSPRSIAPSFQKPTAVRAAALSALLVLTTSALASAQDATDSEATEAANIQTVTEMWEKTFGGDPTAIEAFGDVYVQHNPFVEDGAEAFVQFAAQYGDLDFPLYEIVRSFAQDDFVILHSRFNIDENFQPDPDGPGFAVADFYRLEDGKVVEHWDVLQPAVPADQSASGNDMFSQLTGN